MPAPLGLGHSDDWTRSFLRLEVRFHSSGLGSGCQQNSLCYTPRIRLRYVVNAASSMQRTTVQWTNAGAQSQPARNLAAWLASLSMAGQLRSQLRIRPGKSASRPERRLGDRSASSSSPARENRRDHFRRISKWRTQGSLAVRRRPAVRSPCQPLSPGRLCSRNTAGRAGRRFWQHPRRLAAFRASYLWPSHS